LAERSRSQKRWEREIVILSLKYIASLLFSIFEKSQFLSMKQTLFYFYLMKLPIFGNFDKKTNYMGRNTSVSLGDYFESFVDNSVAEGRYKNASEVIRAGLRLLELEENKMLALKMSLKEGIDSGINKDFHPGNHLKKLKASND